MPYTVHNFQSGDILLASELNEMDTQIASNEEALSNTLSSDSIADDYSNTKTYSIGDYCFHDGTLYRCITDISVAENWTAAHWQEAVLSDDVTDLKNQFRIL